MAESISLLNESSDSEVEFSINKNYAEKYDLWRNKEEMQKLKDLSKDISETSSSESEEEDPVIEKDFLKTLSLLKSKDPKIYNENIEFFSEKTEQKKPKVKKEKPMFMKDYERTLVLERNGKFSDEEDDVPNKTLANTEELGEITKSFKVSDAESGDENHDSELGGLFQIRKKTKEEEEQEEEEHLQWLKGQKKNIDKQTEKDMSFLRNFWNDPKLDDGEKFLRDYLLNHGYVEKSKSDEIPSYAEITEDAEALLEDEKDLEQQEMFEHKYNFRFEEPDQEFIKRYPRTVGDSLRRVDNKRKMKREDYAERKKKEKEQKREELKRLKALKRKEIEEKFFKLKETIGKEELNFDEDDIESDFDPDKHDEKMKELFNDDYYAEEEEQKPNFLFDEEIDDENWDHWTREEASASSLQKMPENEVGKEKQESTDEDEQVMDRKAQFEQEMVESTHTGRRKGRKKSLFAKVVAQPKPLYDPNGKSFEEYLEEYFKLDYEDVIGDLPVRFKYRKVIPNDFGLTVDEILTANDKELNRWCSVKKTCQYRRDEEELYDVQAFKKKSQNIAVKQKILSSVYAPEKDEAMETITNPSGNNENETKRKKKRSTKKKSLEDDLRNNHDNATLNLENVHMLKETLEHSNPSSDRLAKGKKRKHSKSTEEIPHRFTENGHMNNPHGISSEGVKNISFPEESTVYAEENKNSDDNSFKRRKKKHKKNTDLVEDAFEDSTAAVSASNVLDVYSNENSSVEEKVEKDLSCYNAETATNNTEQTKSVNKKSKRKNRKRKGKTSFEDKKIKQYLSEGKGQQKNTETDKRLAISNERLAAFGINPKKFKNSIIYSKK